jgi:hypothetical protein
MAGSASVSFRSFRLRPKIKNNKLFFFSVGFG